MSARLSPQIAALFGADGSPESGRLSSSEGFPAPVGAGNPSSAHVRSTSQVPNHQLPSTTSSRATADRATVSGRAPEGSPGAEDAGATAEQQLPVTDRQSPAGRATVEGGAPEDAQGTADGRTAPGEAGGRPSTAPQVSVPDRSALALSASGGYAARLVTGGGSRYPERWTLDGPEPYAVPLPGSTPENPASEVLPLADGRVLIARPGSSRYDLALLYPSGPGTGEVPLGGVETERLQLLPPTPDGRRVYALASPSDDQGTGGEPRQEAGGRHRGKRSGAHAQPPGAEPTGVDGTCGDGTVTEVWLVYGGAFGPELVAEVPGAASGGAWLDREGLLLGLDRTDVAGRTRALTVPVDGSGDPAALLQISEESNDRLLLAEPDSGLLLVASDAPGHDRIGWGVLDSHRPVRFPDALCPECVTVTPLAIQPGQMLLPEACGVALRLTGHDDEWVAVWRPQQRGLQYFPAPPGWLPGAAHWTDEGELLLPQATEGAPCSLTRIPVPVPALRPLRPGRHTQPGHRGDEDGLATAGTSVRAQGGGAPRVRQTHEPDDQTDGADDAPPAARTPAGRAERAPDGRADGQQVPGQEHGTVFSDGSSWPDPADSDHTPASARPHNGAPREGGERQTAGPSDVPGPCHSPGEGQPGGAICRPVPLHRAPQARQG